MLWGRGQLEQEPCAAKALRAAMTPQTIRTQGFSEEPLIAMLETKLMDPMVPHGSHQNVASQKRLLYNRILTGTRALANFSYQLQIS